MLLTKAQGARGDQHRRRRQLAEKLLRERHNEAAVAAGYRMADLIALCCVEKQHVVCVRNCLLTANVAGVHTSVGKDQVRDGRAPQRRDGGACQRTARGARSPIL